MQENKTESTLIREDITLKLKTTGKIKQLLFMLLFIELWLAVYVFKVGTFFIRSYRLYRFIPGTWIRQIKGLSLQSKPNDTDRQRVNYITPLPSVANCLFQSSI